MFGLGLREVEAGLQGLDGGRAVVTVPDGLDDILDLFERRQSALEDVSAVLGLREVVFGAPPDDLLSVGAVPLKNLLQVKHLGLAVDQRDVGHPEGGLEMVLE